MSAGPPVGQVPPAGQQPLAGWPPGPPPPTPPGVGTIARTPGTQATFVDRLLASLLDGIILQVVIVILTFVGLAAVFMLGLFGDRLLGVLVGSLIVLVLLLVVGSIGLQIGYEMLTGRRRGQTYGKHVMNTVVVDSATGQPGIGVGRAAVRFLARWVSGAVFGIGYLWMLWDPNQRTLHDLMTGTTVVRGPQERTRSPLQFARELDVVPGTSQPRPDA